MSRTTWSEIAGSLRNTADVLDDGDVSVRALLARGFDIQGGMLVYETSNGAVPISPSYVAPSGGQVPTGLETEVARERHRLSSTYARAWQRQFALSLSPGPMGGSEVAYGRLSRTEQNALSEGTDAQGGVLVPPDVHAEILSRLSALSVVRGRATVVPTITDQLRLPAFKAHATLGSTYASDWVGGWQPEVPSANSADPSFETFEIAVRKARSGVLRLSNDLAQDAPSALGFVIDVGSRDLSLVVDGGLIAGTGANHTPRGLLESGATEIDIEGSSANSISSTTTNAGSGPKIAALLENLPAQHRRGATMLASTTGEAALMKLIDGAGARLYKRGEPVEGLRVDISAHMEADAVDGNVPVLVGDLSAYIIAERSMQIIVMRERFADTDQLGIIIVERLGGGLWNTDAIRLGAV